MQKNCMLTKVLINITQLCSKEALVILLLFRCLSGMCTARRRNTSSGGFPSCSGSWRVLYVRMTELTYVTARTVLCAASA